MAIGLYFFFPLVNNFSVFAVPLRNGKFCDNKFEALKDDFNFAGSETLPGDVHFECA